ncbi:MAG: hypothetical protein ACRDDX_14775 [Cellulosilyticaceae bacterium]
MIKKAKVPLGLLALLTAIYLFLGFLASRNMFYSPTLSQVDLRPLLEKQSFTEADYTLLFEQTGLAKPVIDELATSPDFVDKLLGFQANYFEGLDVQKTSMNFITRQDYAFDADGNTRKAFQLAPYHNGYIFLTKSTYTANWRHGHAGLVIDETRGKVLESLEPGTVSVEQNASRWEYYPTFKMMRLKDTPQEKMDEIAAFASENLMDIPYNILTMKNAVDRFDSTHCSFIVWQAFKAFDLDLDATGGIFISPQDIAASPLLEVLQIYGFDPNRVW